MNKAKLVEAFITQLETDIHALEQNIKETKEEATHEESKPENEYDTRALETGYLVKAQSKRILDAKEALAAFKNVPVKSFQPTDPIQATALIHLDMDGKKLWFLFMPSGGGHSLQFEGRKIQIITSASPLGEALLGQISGSFVSIENGDDVKEIEILSVS